MSPAARVSKRAGRRRGKAQLPGGFPDAVSPFFRAAERAHAETSAACFVEVSISPAAPGTGTGPVIPASPAWRISIWIKVLGGDIIVEQNIQMLDVANWFLVRAPV